MKYKDEIPKTLRQVLKSSKAHKIIARTLELTDAKTAQFFEILRTLRNRADYETGIVLNDRDLNRALNLARELINSVNNIINTITPKTLYQVLQDLQRL
jgi:sugar-specific transcriptional regulator TrmB